MNKLIISGNLGRDPEMSYAPSGAATTKFSVAVNNRKKGKDGEYQNETTWINCVAWNKLAETCSTYLKKGSKVLVEGRLDIRKYTDKNGTDRTAVEVILNSMEMLDSKKSQDDGNVTVDALGEFEDHPF